MKQLSSSIFITSLLLFSACGGGGGDSTTSNGDNTAPKSNTITFSGIAVDGYISGATACLDKNINGICDSGEPTTRTDANGKFTFTGIEVDSGILMPVIVRGGIDTATNKPFEGSLSNIINTDDIATNSSFTVSPLTDLVATLFIASNDKSSTILTDIKTNVASSLNINIEKVDSDPMQDKEVFAKAQEVQQTKELILAAATKVASTTLSSDELVKSVSEAIATSVQSGTTLSSADVITKLEESQPSVSIPSNETDFIERQTTEIINALATIVSDTSVTTDTLNQEQSDLETVVETASTSIEEATEGSTIAVVIVVPVDDTPVCAQVLSYATSPTTQECQTFATPCDIPSGWVSCEPVSTPVVTSLPTPPAPPAL